MTVKRRRTSVAARLGCVRQLVLLGLLWGIFVAFNTVVRKFAPSLEFRLGQVSVVGFVLSAVELFVAWWISLKITNAAMGGMLARAVAREEEMARLEAAKAEEAAAAGKAGEGPEPEKPEA
jgi:Zn-dependent protease with chaperone function